MADRRATARNHVTSRTTPATTPEAQEQNLISLAEQLAERQMADGTASAQVITHYLKLGSSRERLEQDRLRHEILLLETKRESMISGERAEELIAKAIDALRSYGGDKPFEPEADE